MLETLYQTHTTPKLMTEPKTGAHVLRVRRLRAQLVEHQKWVGRPAVKVGDASVHSSRSTSVL